jgi:hypothetical protein
MQDGVVYWVMQTLGGQTYAHGPYSSERSAENRRDKVQGGEIVIYKTFTRDPVQAVQEFNMEELE